MYSPPGRYLWDFWFAPREADAPYHLFHLQAPRSLADPDQRHWHATIGHAVSTDLRSWQPLPDALGPGPAGAWDELATWTGSVVAADGRFRLFYTGVDRHRVQRIGMAESTDLITWRRSLNRPLLEPSAPWYATPATARRPGGADWRDPFVIRDPDRPRWLMFFTAALADEPPDRCGAIGLATSDDLVHWSLHPPVTPPGLAGQLEVPQAISVAGRRYLVCCTDEPASPLTTSTNGAPWIGTHYFRADSITGPYRLSTDRILAADPPGTTYAGRVLEGPAGDPCFLAFQRLRPDGTFAGTLIDPIPIAIDGSGELSLAR